MSDDILKSAIADRKAKRKRRDEEPAGEEHEPIEVEATPAGSPPSEGHVREHVAEHTSEHV